MRDCARPGRGGGIYIGNNDRCNGQTYDDYPLSGNQSADRYSDNIWVIFNHVYDVLTGVSVSQKVFCGGGGCCCTDCQAPTCPDNTSCCASPSPGPTYEPARTYVVGNVFHHILPPFCTTPTSAPPLTEPPFCGSQYCQPDYCDPVPPCDTLPCCDPSLCIERGAFGQAVAVGHQSQVRVVNNTMYKCAQGVHVLCTYDLANPNPKDCPPGGDPNNKTRNTEVAVVNNVMLDTPDDGDNDTQVRVCTGPWSGNTLLPFTLTNGEFDHNLHFGAHRYFRIPSSPYPPNDIFDTVEEVQFDLHTNYGADSKGDSPTHHPMLVNPAQLRFDLTAASPAFMLTGGAALDPAYLEFQTEFGDFSQRGHIYHDYDGHEYPGPCPIGAFGN